MKTYDKSNTTQQKFETNIYSVAKIKLISVHMCKHVERMQASDDDLC